MHVMYKKLMLMKSKKLAEIANSNRCLVVLVLGIRKNQLQVINAKKSGNATKQSLWC